MCEKFRRRANWVYNRPWRHARDALAKNPEVDKIAFTGSTGVGQSIIRNGADTLKELGDKSPNIIFADANMEAAHHLYVDRSPREPIRFKLPRGSVTEKVFSSGDTLAPDDLDSSFQCSPETGTASERQIEEIEP